MQVADLILVLCTTPQKDSCTSQTEDFRGKMAVMAADAGDIATAVDLAQWVLIRTSHAALLQAVTWEV